MIYGLVDPRDGQLRYVGKSSNGLSRPRTHWKNTRLRESRDHCHNWIRNVLLSGRVPDVVVIQDICENDSDILNDSEVFWISYFRKMGCHLTNMSDGGEGQNGFRHSHETREKMRLSHTGKSSGAKGKIPWNKGMTYTSPKISVALKGKRKVPRQIFLCSFCSSEISLTPSGAALKRKNRFCNKKCMSDFKRG